MNCRSSGLLSLYTLNVNYLALKASFAQTQSGCSALGYFRVSGDQGTPMVYKPRKGRVVLVIDNNMVSQLLDVPSTLRALEESYIDLANGDGICRPRIDMRIPTGDEKSIYQWGTMEGGSAKSGYFAIRIKSDVLEEQVVNGNRTQEKYCIKPGTFMGLVLLLSIRNGEPLALLNDGILQHVRVSCDSAIGVKYGAKQDAAVIAMIGSGGMARGHLEGILSVRNISEVRVYSPTIANRQRFADEMSELYGIDVHEVDSPQTACKGADIVCGCTDAVGAVIYGDQLTPGTHVTSIGGRPDENARDRFDSWLRLADASIPFNNPNWSTREEYIYYKAQPNHRIWNRHLHGSKGWNVDGLEDKIVTLSEVINNQRQVRTSDTDITFSERGNAQGAQFHAICGLIYERAIEKGLGREIPTEWLVQDIRD